MATKQPLGEIVGEGVTGGEGVGLKVTGGDEEGVDPGEGVGVVEGEAVELAQRIRRS